MAMQSLNLLPELQKLPGPESDQRKSFQDMITDLLNMDRGLYAAAAAAAVSFAMWGIFDTINVDDKLAQAHEMAFGNYEGSLYEHWQEMAEGGSESMTGFISALKGKYAELDFAEKLEARGFNNVEIATDSSQPGGISAISPEGAETLFQVETGLADRAGEVQQLMAENPNIHYALSTEIHDRIHDSALDTKNRITNIGSNDALVQKIENGLKTSSIDDKLGQAHEKAFGTYEGSLHEHWQEMLQRGGNAPGGFLNPLKGKVAELNFVEDLEARGYTNVKIPDDPTHPVWDISAISPDGEEVLFQVKTGLADRAGEVQQLMAENPNIHYAISTEIYDKIYDSAQDTINQITDRGTEYELVEGTMDGLETLSANQGFDLPDSVGEMVPYAGAIIMGARLIYNVIKTEKEFSTADRTTKNKMQVVQTLTLMSRFSVSTVLSTAGGFGGAAAGSPVPGVGNVVGGFVGMVAGALIGIYLNKHLQPHMLNLALNITGLTHDDLFYYKNKPHIDSVALSFRQNAGLLTDAS